MGSKIMFPTAVVSERSMPRQRWLGLGEQEKVSCKDQVKLLKEREMRNEATEPNRVPFPFILDP